MDDPPEVGFEDIAIDFLRARFWPSLIRRSRTC